MNRWTIAAVLGAILVATPALAHDDPRLRMTGTSLLDFEQKLFGQQAGQQQAGQPQGSLAQSKTPFDAHFQDLSLTPADRQRLLQDLQRLNQIPEGSRVRLGGKIDGRSFHADVRNHKGELDVSMRGVQFGSRQEAQAFMDSLRQGGADRIRVKGMIDGQRFHASYRDHNGKVEQRFQMKEPKDGTVITTGSGRSHVAGATAKPKPEGEHGRKYDNDHSGSGRSHGGSGKSLSSAGSGSSGKSGHGRLGKD